MKSLQKIIKKKKSPVNKWYDIIDDWELIESSFATQYGLRFSDINNMHWDEFCTLLSGIMPKTPLGQIVGIRSEEDKDILKSFTKEQHKIRNDWISKTNSEKFSNMSDEEKLKKTQEAQNIFKNLCK